MARKATIDQEIIIEATVKLLQRYGPDKINMVDIAKELKITHGTLYRYFSSKKALFEAVIEDWLERISGPLADIAAGKGAPDKRLEKWLLTLVGMKFKKVHDDPELFATYHQIAEQSHDVIVRHIDTLVGQLSTIVEAGIEAGIFKTQNPKKVAQSIFEATAIYHHPYHVMRQTKTPEKEVKALVGLLLDGLR